MRHLAGNKHYAKIQYARYLDVAGEAGDERTCRPRLLLTTRHRQQTKRYVYSSKRLSMGVFFVHCFIFNFLRPLDGEIVISNINSVNTH